MVAFMVIVGVLLLLGLFSKKNREDKEYTKAAKNVATLGFMYFVLPPLFIIICIIMVMMN